MKRWFLLLILLTPAMARGQEVCVPQPLPWFEDFETGFTWENGWINTSLDTTYFEYDNCWIHGIMHYCGWHSMISFEYLSYTPPVVRNNLLHIEKSYWDILGYEPGLKYAVTPEFASSPSWVTFYAYYPLAYIHGAQISDPLVDTVFPDGLMVGIGYITDTADPLDSYVPVDTVFVTSRDGLAKTFCCSSLGGQIIPPPYRLAFRVADPMADWRGNIICYIDSITVSDEPPSELRYDTALTLVLGDTLRFEGQDISAAGCYIFRHPLAGGCDSMVVLTVSYAAIGLTASASGPCPGDAVTLGATGTRLCRWNAVPDDPELALQQGQSTVVVHPEATTTYRLLDAADSVVASVTVEVVRPLTPCVEVKPDHIDYDQPVVLLSDCSTGSVQSTWRFSDGVTLRGAQVRRRFKQPLPDSVDVILTSCAEGGCCIDTAFTIFRQVRSVWFPNAFSPDAESNNRFGGVPNCEVVEYRLEIYNRRGLLVWQTDDPACMWDGRRDGRPQPQGAYVYKWALLDTFGERHHGTGTLTLLR